MAAKNRFVSKCVLLKGEAKKEKKEEKAQEEKAGAIRAAPCGIVETVPEWYLQRGRASAL